MANFRLSDQKEGNFGRELDGTKLTVIVKEEKNGKKAMFITAYWD
jgi:hypothetical protein